MVLLVHIFMAPSMLYLLILIPLVSSTSNQVLNHHSMQNGFRVSLSHIDSSHNFSKLQLVQRSLNRAKNRLQRLASMAATGPGNGVEAPVHAGNGEFLMNVSIGTPAIPFSMIMDTGSDLIWTQCSPCTKCFKQPTPVFNPAKSSTWSNVSCSSDLCKDMNIFKCENGCKYLYLYGDQSSTEGFMAMDTFTFEDSLKQVVPIPKIGFGCGVNNQGSGLGQGSGLVGLGRGPLSLASQLGVTKFSYCLTSMGGNQTSSSTLLLGSLADLNYTSGANHGTQVTPLVQNPYLPTFYYISLEGITVGETLLPISNSLFKLKEDGSGGMIIDSGTTITYLFKEAFDVLKEEFMSQMKLRVSGSSDTTGLDLCFDLPTKNVTEIMVPKLKFHFTGLDLELPVENYMIADESLGLVCLAMGASGAMSIFGNIQQQNLLVLHDLEKETLSFVPTQCEQL
ncbi:aspartic proteinase nepenthesin-1-like [Cornus florida]|uniref:aspartic proteinase nepenthesin-1-like n=1 Tax=Cornus florida TaxID=4283 RepID=UPI002896FC81|nr:aspartic proteinase nepenthesin-1-like [Cornus florida]